LSSLCPSNHRQELELDNEKNHFAVINDNTEKRRSERHAKFPAKKKKKDRNLSNTIKGSEKYRDMEDHRIELADLFQRLEVNPEIVGSLFIPCLINLGPERFRSCCKEPKVW